MEDSLSGHEINFFVHDSMPSVKLLDVQPNWIFYAGWDLSFAGSGYNDSK